MAHSVKTVSLKLNKMGPPIGITIAMHACAYVINETAVEAGQCGHVITSGTTGMSSYANV